MYESDRRTGPETPAPLPQSGKPPEPPPIELIAGDEYPLVSQNFERLGFMIPALLDETKSIADILGPEMEFMLAERRSKKADTLVPALEKDMLDLRLATYDLFDPKRIPPPKDPVQEAKPEPPPAPDDMRLRELIILLHPDTNNTIMAQATGGNAVRNELFQTVIEARNSRDVAKLNSLYAQIMPRYYAAFVEEQLAEGMSMDEIAAQHPELFTDLLTVIHIHIAGTDRVTNVTLDVESYQAYTAMYNDEADRKTRKKNTFQYSNAAKHAYFQTQRLIEAREKYIGRGEEPLRTLLKETGLAIGVLQQRLLSGAHHEFTEGRAALSNSAKHHIGEEIKVVGQILYQLGCLLLNDPENPDLHLYISNVPGIVKRLQGYVEHELG